MNESSENTKMTPKSFQMVKLDPICTKNGFFRTKNNEPAFQLDSSVPFDSDVQIEWK